MPNDPKNVSGGVFANKGEDFKVRSDTPLVQFKRECVDPPSYEYVGVEDILQISGSANQGGASVTVNLRIMRADGIVITIQFVAPLNGFAASAATRFNVPEGYILSGTATYSGNTAPGFRTYLIVSLVRQPFGITGTYKILFQGYIYGTIPVSFEDSPTQRPSDGAGYPRTVQQAAPAAGSEFVYSVPANVRQKIICFNTTFATSAAVGNRLQGIQIDDGGANVMAFTNTGIAQAASLSFTYTYMDGLPLGANLNNTIIASLPVDLVLPPGFRIQSKTSGILAGDQYSNINFLVVEWLDNN